MNKTPETDEAQHEGLLRGNPMPTKVVTANFARKLEQSRDEWAAMCGRYKQERDEAREHWGTETMNAAQFLSEKTKAIAERDKERTELEMWMDGNILHEIHRNELEKVERERDEALEKLSDWENAAAHVEADHPDEKHCGCVPVLCKLLTDAREQIKELIYIAGRATQ